MRTSSRRQVLTSVLIGISIVSGAISEESHPPYPPSPVIQSLKWEGAVLRLGDGTTGDNWPLTWADDTLFAAFGDGDGFSKRPQKLSLGFARILGSPPDHKGEDVVSRDDVAVGWGQNGIKASGMLMVSRVLYMFVRNYKVEDDWKHSRLARSSDRGKSWTWADWYFSETFGCPDFVQFGKSYAGARDRYVYIVSQDNNNAYAYSPRIVLARVPKNRLPDRTAYRFFAGFHNSKPLSL